MDQSLLERLEARAAIADLVHTYAHNIRSGRGADCAELFTEDAVFEVRESNLGGHSGVRTRSTLNGRAEIIDYIARGAAAQAQACPLIHNLLIQVQGDKASSLCMMTTRAMAGRAEFVGEYSDRFRKEDRWLFSGRTYTILGQFMTGTTPT